jgi:SAM-dependent methyltransferase
MYVQVPFTPMFRVTRLGSWKLGVGNWELGVGSCLCVVAFICALAAPVRAQRATVSVTWADLAPFHSRLEARGISEASFPSYVERIRKTNAQRVREGDLDHLVFYMLQSRRFTSLPPIEPALSSKTLFDALDDRQRTTFLRESTAPSPLVPTDVQARAAALIRALDSPGTDERLVYFREVAQTSFPIRRERLAALIREYIRAMRFVYEKEFVAQKSASPAAEVAALYRSRGLSTDTAVEAGYLVYQGLGIVKSLAAERQIRRVLIVGPGLDLAPRTALHEEGPPQSYQPWAVIDALVSLGLARLDDLTVIGADINPRVVGHIRRAAAHPPLLTLTSEIRETAGVTLTADYRDYFKALGQGIGTVSQTTTASDRLVKTVRVNEAAARALSASTVDIVTERLDTEPFDVAIATNILPYFDEVQLTLALANVAAMLRPGGVLLHNESRPLVGEVTETLGVRFEQSRHATIASVRGAPPLGDSVWVHRKLR